MNCCDDYGNCNQGRDCPVRKQRIKEINDAYVNGYKVDDPLDDLADTFKGLLTAVTVVLGVWIAFLLFWGKF